jgi:3-oxoacyl-[acyl-carrier-protein] synthase-1
MALSIRALGLASSLGGLVPACAAYRAGMTRPGPALDVSFMARGDEEPQPITVHAVRAATYGFTGVGRLAALVTEALMDLPRDGDTRLAGGGSGMFLALPDPHERVFSLGRDPDDDDDPDPAKRIDLLGGRVLSAATAASGRRLSEAPPRCFGGGHVAFARALEAADRALAARELSAAWVIAVDTLLSPTTLQHFMREDRLKRDETPTGFTPGEAAVAVLVERAQEPHAQRSGGVLVRAIKLGAEPPPEASGRPSDGRALAGCLLSVLRRAAASTSLPVLLSDHDGETPRAMELGSTQVQLSAQDHRLAASPVWLPATSFGNTGAASAGLALAIAVRADARGYAPSSLFVVLSSAYDGNRSAILLEGAGARP